MAARLRPRTSIVWPRGACVSPSSITQRGAGRRVAALLTGYYAQQVRRDTVPGVSSGNKGNRPSWAKLLPQRLRPQGYRSYHAGKWHVDGMPLANGFDHSYYLEDLGRYFHPRVLFEDDRKLPPIEPGSDYYETVAIADHGIKYLKDHATAHAEQPFFLYLAFKRASFSIARTAAGTSRGIAIAIALAGRPCAAERWQRIKQLGLIQGRLSDVERQVGPPYESPKVLEILGPGEVNRPVAWSALSTEQAAFQATKMAIHAAMVDRMDREIGRLLDQLRAMDAFENTLIFLHVRQWRQRRDHGS